MNSINETVNKRRGRPALGNVLFARRVSPAVAERLRAIVDVEGGPRPANITFSGGLIVEAGEPSLREAVKEVMTNDLKMAMELAAIKKQLEAMTTSYVDECEKVAALSLRLDHLNREMDDCLGMTEEDKTRYWRDRAFRAEAAIKARGGEYDQGG